MTDNALKALASPEAHMRAALERISDPAERMALLMQLFHEEFRKLQKEILDRPV